MFAFDLHFGNMLYSWIEELEANIILYLLPLFKEGGVEYSPLTVPDSFLGCVIRGMKMKVNVCT